MKTKRRLLSWLLCAALLGCLLPAGALAADSITYIDENGTTQTCASAAEVTSNDTTWGGDVDAEYWYVVTGTVTIGTEAAPQRVTVTGNVHLILADNSSLTVHGGINVAEGNSLTIYAQSTDKDEMGSLTATVGDLEANDGNAGIGGGNSQSCGTITINGGNIVASCSSRAELNSNNVDIFQGTGAGIGGGNSGSGGTITINGGYVEAIGAMGAGIGGGQNGAGGTIRITGGVVEVMIPYVGHGTGIGGGYLKTSDTDSTITITGGLVNASSCMTFDGDYNGAIGYTGTNIQSVVQTIIPKITGGMVFDNKIGKVYGDFTLTESYTIPTHNDTYVGVKNLVIPAGSTLIIEEGVTLTIPSGSTLTIAEGGSIVNNGAITVADGGTLDINGDVTGTGSLSNSGTVEQKAQTAPAPTLEAVTANSITLKTETAPVGVHYGYIATGVTEKTWYDSPVFNNLLPGTAYIFWIMYDVNQYYAQAISESATFYTAYAAPTGTEGYTIDYANETVTAARGYEVRLMESDNWTTDALDIAPGGSFQIRHGADAGGAPASSAVTVNTAARPTAPAAPTINYADETLSTTTAMEYAVVASGQSVPNTWAACSENMSAAALGWSGSEVTVQFRTAATTSNYASEAVSVTIPAQPSAPTCQGINETFANESDGKITGLDSGNAYQISSDNNTWADATLTDGAIINLAPGTYYVRVKATDSSFASKAATVEIATGAARTYTLNVTAPSFDAVTYGYAQPEAKPITITSSGNSAAAISGVTVDSQNFVIGGSGSTVTAGGEITSWTIQPAANLGVGTYTATITVTYDNGATATDTVSFTVNPAAQDAPAAPELESSTTSSITLKAVPDNENGAKAEYSRDGGSTWQASPTFEGLSSGTAYTFAVRYAATGSYAASPASPAASFSTQSSGGGGGSSSGGGSSDSGSSDSGNSGGSTDTPEAGNPFTDVHKTDWFYDDVMFVYENGLMAGTSATTFEPNSNTTRAQIAVIFYRMEGSAEVTGESPFTDVKQEPGTLWYYNAVIWAQQSGMMAGYGDGTFGPNDPVTREQLASIFCRYAQYKGYDVSTTGSLDSFTDKDSVSAWAQEAMKWAVGNGMINGRENNLLDPQGTSTRAEIAAMLHRFLEE